MTDRVDASGGSVARLEPNEPIRLWEVAAIATLALVVRLAYLDHPPLFDELYHVMAARSWAADGTLAIGDGEYTRTAAFTKLVGVLFKLFGASLEVARLPAVVAGTLWVGALAWWSGRLAGRTVGWIAGLLFCLDAGSIALAQFARFYTLHGLLFFVGAVAIFGLVGRQWPGRRAVIALAVAFVSLSAAMYFQFSTLVGIAAIGLWLLGVMIWRAVAGVGAPGALRRKLGWTRSLAAAAGALVALLIAMVLLRDTLMVIWRLYRFAPAWAAPTANEIRWYEGFLWIRYPTLWSFLPAAIVIGAVRHRAMLVFSAFVFGVSFALVSLASAKAERYIYFAIPFFFSIWGLAFAVVLPLVRRGATSLVEGLLGRSAPSALPRIASLLAPVGIALFAAYYSTGFDLTRRMLFPGDRERPYMESDWAAAADSLKALADSVELVVVTALPKAAYFIQRGDVTLSRTELAELTVGTEEFTVDPRTGQPAISAPASLGQLMECFDTGLLIIEEAHWRRADVVSDSTADFVIAHTREIAMPPSWHIKAFRWDSPGGPADRRCHTQDMRSYPTRWTDGTD